MEDYVLANASPLLRRAVTRRRSPRLRVDGALQLRFSTSDEPLTLHDVSFHGFSMWSATPAAHGEIRMFWLTAPGQEPHLLYAVAVHVGPSPPVDERGHFSGWFVQSEASQHVLEEAIDQLTRRPAGDR